MISLLRNKDVKIKKAVSSSNESNLAANNFIKRQVKREFKSRPRNKHYIIYSIKQISKVMVLQAFKCL